MIVRGASKIIEENKVMQERIKELTQLLEAKTEAEKIHERQIYDLAKEKDSLNTAYTRTFETLNRIRGDYAKRLREFDELKAGLKSLQNAIRDKYYNKLEYKSLKNQSKGQLIDIISKRKAIGKFKFIREGV